MIKIENPSMRVDLMTFLESLSNYEYQMNCWVRGNCPMGVEDNFDMSVHFFFDDTGLAQDASSLIGYLLYDETEAELITNVCHAINILFDKYGTKLKDDEYLNKPEWQGILNTAQIAYFSLLNKNSQNFE